MNLLMLGYLAALVPSLVAPVKGHVLFGGLSSVMLGPPFVELSTSSMGA